jgi:hypothetical protein
MFLAPYFRPILACMQFLSLCACLALAGPLGIGQVHAAGRDEIIALYANPKAYPAGDMLLAKMNSDAPRWGPELYAIASQKGLPDKLYIDIARAFIYAGDKKEQVARAGDLLGAAPFALLDRSEWLYLCQKIAQREVSAMPCARRLLREPSFIIRLLGGFDGVGKDYALVFLLLQMPEQTWNREIGDRLWLGADSDSSQIAMLDALFYAVSLRDDAIISKISDDPSRTQAVRVRANFLLAQMSSMERNATPSVLSSLRKSMSLTASTSEEELRDARRSALRQVSRAGLLELERYTFLIRAEALIRWNERLRKLD